MRRIDCFNPPDPMSKGDSESPPYTIISEKRCNRVRTGPHPMPGATSDAIIETQKMIVHGHRRISDLPALGAGRCGSAPRRAAGIPHRRADGPRPAGGLLHRRLHDPPRPALRDPPPHGILHRRDVGGTGALCNGQKGRARRKGEAAGGTLFGDAADQGREVGPAEQDHPGHTVLRGLHRIERLGCQEMLRLHRHRLLREIRLPAAVQLGDAFRLRQRHRLRSIADAGGRTGIDRAGRIPDRTEQEAACRAVTDPAMSTAPRTRRPGACTHRMPDRRPRTAATAGRRSP